MKQMFEVRTEEELVEVISEAFKNILLESLEEKRTLKEELLTTDELCEFLKLSRTSIWSLTKKNIIPFVRIGNQKRYLKSEVVNKLVQLKKEEL